jgi:hypothetical protein
VHNEELYNLYASPNVVRGDKIDVNVTIVVYSTHRRHDKCIQNFSLKTERKRPFGRPRRTWEHNMNT